MKATPPSRTHRKLLTPPHPHTPQQVVWEKRYTKEPVNHSSQPPLSLSMLPHAIFLPRGSRPGVESCSCRTPLLFTCDLNSVTAKPDHMKAAHKTNTHQPTKPHTPLDDRLCRRLRARRNNKKTARTEKKTCQTLHPPPSALDILRTTEPPASCHPKHISHDCDYTQTL